jgi:hypothetical protein
MAGLPGLGTGQEKLRAVMSRIYGPVLELARAHNLAVIDLPRTFDPSDAELYRLQIEPSAKGSALIASCVRYCLESHNFKGPSRLYSQASETGAMRCEANAFTDGNPWTIVRDGELAPADRGAANDALLEPGAMAAELGAQSAHAEALPHAVAQLVDMGFAEADVREALAASGNLPQQALERLLQG